MSRASHFIPLQKQEKIVVNMDEGAHQRARATLVPVSAGLVPQASSLLDDGWTLLCVAVAGDDHRPWNTVVSGETTS